MDGGIGKVVEEEVHLAQLHHLIVNVIAGQIAVNFLALSVREPVARNGRAGRGVVPEDVPVSGDEEAACAARGVENFVVGLWVEAGDHKIDDVARSTELAVLALRAGDLEKIFKGVAKFLAVRIGKPVHFGKEHGEDAAVAKLQESVSEDVAKEDWQMRAGSDPLAIYFHIRSAEQLDATGKAVHPLIGGNSLRHQGTPAVVRQRADKEGALATEIHGLVVEVVHEFVDECDGDEFDLIGRLREFTNEDIPARINTAFGIGG